MAPNDRAPVREEERIAPVGGSHCTRRVMIFDLDVHGVSVRARYVSRRAVRLDIMLAFYGTSLNPWIHGEHGKVRVAGLQWRNGGLRSHLLPLRALLLLLRGFAANALGILSFSLHDKLGRAAHCTGRAI